MQSAPPLRAGSAAIFLLALGVLVLEVALTRIFSVMTYHHFTYLLIGLALLGFGAAGTVLTVHRRYAGPAVQPQVLADAAWLFGLTTLLCFLAITKTRFDAMDISQHRDISQLFGLAMLLVGATIPFFFGGLCIGYLISKAGPHINRLYFFDLLGAGCGSLGALLAINYLGAPATIFVVALLGCVVAMLVGGRADGHVRWRYPLTAVVAAGLALATLIRNDAVPVPLPDSKLVNYHGTDFRWHVVARVDVTGPHDGYPSFGGALSRQWDATQQPMTYLGMYQDGAAFTGIMNLKGEPADEPILSHYMQGCAYVIRPSAKSLVIGPGGGIDVAIALHHGARFVTAVDVNPWTLRYVRDIYDDFAGHLYRRDDVKVVCAEGRHFLTATDEAFDVIQLSGVDTYTALASGAYALTENYLYTREAIEDGLDHLTEQGILSYSRWLFSPPRETLRLAVTAREVLADRGAADPAQHIVVLAAPAWHGRSPWAETLIKREPFTADELDRLKAWCRQLRFDLIYDPLVPYTKGSAYDALEPTSKYDPVRCARVFNTILRAEGDAFDRHVDEYPYVIRPCTDDEPFFFNYYRLANLRHPFKATLGGDPVNRLPLGLLIPVVSLMQILVLGAAFIVYPLRRRAAGLRGQAGLISVLVYFAAIGAGFIAVEIMLLQKLMVFLGGPVYSMAITLFSLLVFCGLGSFLAKRLTDAHPRLAGAVILLLLAGAVVATTAFVNNIIPGWMRLTHWQRGVAAVASLAPLGLLMGMPFPTGIRLTERLAPRLVPWAWSINACATVLGSVTSILVAMFVGFTTVLHAGAALYLLALIALLFIPSPSSRTESSDTGIQSP